MERNIKDNYGRKGVVLYYDQMEQMLSLTNDEFLDLVRAYFNTCLGRETKCSNNACEALRQNYLLQNDICGERYEKKKKHFPLEIFIPYFEKGSYSNVELADIIGCTEGTVRHKRRAWEMSKKEEENNNNKDNNNNNNKDNATITNTTEYDENTKKKRTKSSADGKKLGFYN